MSAIQLSDRIEDTRIIVKFQLKTSTIAEQLGVSRCVYMMSNDSGKSLHMLWVFR